MFICHFNPICLSWVRVPTSTQGHSLLYIYLRVCGNIWGSNSYYLSLLLHPFYPFKLISICIWPFLHLAMCGWLSVCMSNRSRFYHWISVFPDKVDVFILFIFFQICDSQHNLITSHYLTFIINSINHY